MKVKHSIFIWKNSDIATIVSEQNDFDLKNLIVSIGFMIRNLPEIFKAI